MKVFKWPIIIEYNDDAFISVEERNQLTSIMRRNMNNHARVTEILPDTMNNFVENFRHLHTFVSHGLSLFFSEEIPFLLPVG